MLLTTKYHIYTEKKGLCLKNEDMNEVNVGISSSSVKNITKYSSFFHMEWMDEWMFHGRLVSE